jgi:hypothetical protein
MPRQETTLTVFGASPSDVGAERECLQNVIDEINLTRSRDLGIRLELAKWETHAYPGLGSDPQDVINNAIPQDYDIFIGIMWQRFGTPTLRAPSGTIEEFQTAKSRFDQEPKSVRIMIYFKDAPIAPSKIDYAQIKSISEFRSSLGLQGALYWSFEETDEFERLARIHLQKAMQDWREDGFALSGGHAIAAIDTQAHAAAEAEDDDAADSQLGVLDLTLEFTERFSEAGIHMATSYSVMEDATAKISDLGARISAQGTAVTAADMRKMVNLTKEVAAVFNEFDRDFSKSANLAADSVEAGIDAMIKVVEMQNYLTTKDDREVAVNLIRVMENVQNSIEGYRDQISATASGLDTVPSITSDMNRARRSLRKTFIKVVERQDQAVGLVRELKQAIFSLIQNSVDESRSPL